MQELFRALFFDRWSGRPNWIAIGVVLLVGFGLGVRAWRFVRPNDRAAKFVAKALAVFVFFGGGCLLLYLNDIGEKIWYWNIRPIDLVGLVPIIGGGYFFWDFFLNPKARD
jgi:hypothetical protein